MKFPYNPTEGVLRKVKNSYEIYDAKGYQRFYRDSNMCVLCGGQEYLIATNWFGDPPEGGGLPANRRAFYNWVSLKTQSKFKNV